MPFQTSITLEGSDRLEAALGKLSRTFAGDGFNQVLRVVAQRLSILLEIEYPPQSNAPLPRFYRWADGKLHKFKSLKQQAFVILLGKAGKIPYQRRFSLMQGARFRIAPLAGGGAEINITLQGEKGRYVFGREQSHYFQKYTQWRKEPFNLRELEQKGQVTEALILAIDSLFEELGLQ